MRIRKGFVIQEVGGQWIAVATGEAAKQFGGIAKLNATGALVWRGLEEGLTRDEIVARMLAEYDATAEQAAADVDALCQRLLDAGIAEE